MFKDPNLAIARSSLLLHMVESGRPEAYTRGHTALWRSEAEDNDLAQEEAGDVEQEEGDVEREEGDIEREEGVVKREEGVVE